MMTRPRPASRTHRTVSVLQAEQRARMFVGRSRELSVLGRLLTRDAGCPRLAYVHGIAGIGKSALLAAFARLARGRRRRVIEVDSRFADGTPSGLLAGIALAVGVAPTTPEDVAASVGRRDVLLIDTLDLVPGGAEWLVRALWPHLPAEALLVFASRAPQPSDWTLDPGIAPLCIELPLGCLSRTESLRVLAATKAPAETHARIADAMRGHPLGLSLAASASGQDGLADGLCDDAIPVDLFDALLRRFVGTLLVPLQQRALVAASLLWTTDLQALEAVVGPDDAAASFAWLGGLPFMRSTRQGVYPHDVVRAAVLACAREREPDRLAALEARVREYYLSGLANRRDAALLRGGIGLALGRERDMSKWFNVDPEAQKRLRRVRESERRAIEAMLTRLEGANSAESLRHWWDRQPEGLTVLVDGDDTVAAFTAVLTVDPWDASAAGPDEVVRTVQRHARSLLGASRGGTTHLIRFTFCALGHDVAAHGYSAITLAHGGPLFGKSDTVLYYAVAPPGGGADSVFARLGAVGIDAHGNDSGDHGSLRPGFDIRFLDFRDRTPSEWLAGVLRMVPPDSLQASANVRAAQAAPRSPDLGPSVDSRAFCRESVRTLLRALHQPERLREHPFVASRTVRARVSGDRSSQALTDAARKIVVETAERVRGLPGGRALHDVLRTAYLEPADSQEIAAEDLCISSATYRRRLLRSLETVAQLLWELERAHADSERSMGRV